MLKESKEKEESNESEEAKKDEASEDEAYMTQPFLDQSDTSTDALEAEPENVPELPSRSLISSFFGGLIGILKYPLVKQTVKSAEPITEAPKDFLTIEIEHFEEAFQNFNQSDISVEILSSIYN